MLGTAYAVASTAASTAYTAACTAFTVADTVRTAAYRVYCYCPHARKQVLEASRAGDLDRLRMVVNAMPHVLNDCRDIRGKTPLIYAAAFNRIDVVQYLLSREEVDVMAVDDTQKTALHHACKCVNRKQPEEGGISKELCIEQAAAAIYNELGDCVSPPHIWVVHH